MKKFKVPVIWQMYGVYEIEANSLEEAKNKVFDMAIPLPEGNYIDDSIQLDDETVISEMNKEKFKS